MSGAKNVSYACIMLSRIVRRLGSALTPLLVSKSMPAGNYSIGIDSKILGRGMVAWIILGVAAPFLAGQITVSQLRTYSLEELMGMEVTSVSRKPEPFYETAGAVGVLTGTDVHQIGSRNLATALRYMPGVQVARVDSRTWAVTARGFNMSESNKMLVLIDGRTVYTPLFSGVFWDVQDTFLPDLDRIEVIRGPGATMWGANAVNGVISVTTKDARYTQGGLLTAGIGTEEKSFAGVRYGGEVKGKFFYRVYAQTAQRDSLVRQGGSPSFDDWSMNQVGFRIDSVSEPEVGSFTVQGDYYDGEIGSTVSKTMNTPISGGNILVRGSRSLSSEMQLTTQLYFDHVARAVERQYGEIRHTYDFDTQLRFIPWEHHDVVSGISYRSSSDHLRSDGILINFLPTRRRIEVAGAFIQDEIRWHEERYGLILGSKFEYHESVGLEVQPSARLALRMRQSTLWTSVSRAVRTPSRFDEDVTSGSLARPTLLGSRDVVSESVLAYEVGYRAQLTSSFTGDVSVFYNDYDNLRSFERPAPATPGGPIPQIPRTIGNKLLAETYGAEVILKWQPVRWWRVQGSYTYLGERLHLALDSRDPTEGVQEANDPKHAATIRSHLEIMPGLEWDLGIRYVSSLPHPAVPPYVATDTRIAWRYRGQWEFALVGQNLFDNQHPEFGAGGPSAPQVERGFYGSVTWEF